MKKWLGTFILLLMFGVSSAISYNIGLSRNTAGAYENIQIHYTISLDESTSVQYSLTLDGEEYTEVLKSESAITYLIDNTHILSTSNIPAGDYNVTLSFSTAEGSTVHRRVLSIEPTPMFLVSRNNVEVVCFQNTTKETLLIQNAGNVPLDIGFELEGSIHLTIAPTAFLLERGSEKELNITITKPPTGRVFNVTFNAAYEGMSVSRKTVFSVVIPDVSISFDADYETGNQTTLLINFSNMGNIGQNVTFTVIYFTMEGVREHSFHRFVEPRKNLSFSEPIDIPENSKILSISATYLNNEGNEQSITRNYGVFGIAFPPALLNAFATIWTNTTYRGILISASIVIAIYLFYNFVLKKKISRKR